MKELITKSGLEIIREKLNEKLDHLKTLRDEKSHAYAASGDGWHDNPGWIQLGQQEDMLIAEIKAIQEKISNSVVIDASTIDMEKVSIGCKVELVMRKLHSPSVVQTIYIVGSGESDPKNKKVSYNSPLGNALFNMSDQEEKEVELPAGKVIVKIQSISYE
jgi:transcription elongation factor GreA